MEFLEPALAALERLRRAATVHDVATSVDDVLPRVGLSGYALTRLGSRDKPATRAVLVERWDDGWVEHYADAGYLHTDPILAFAEKRLDGFTWQAVRGDRAGVPEAGTFFSDAARFGLSDGVAFPLRSLSSAPAAAVFGGPAGEIPPSAHSFLQMVAMQAHAKLTGVVIHAVSDTSERGVLTRRERECLQWCAEGKTSWEISQILAISQHTADWYLASATRKLAAANRLHAVAEALRRSLIS